MAHSALFTYTFGTVSLIVHIFRELHACDTIPQFRNPENCNNKPTSADRLWHTHLLLYALSLIKVSCCFISHLTSGAHEVLLHNNCTSAARRDAAHHLYNIWLIGGTHKRVSRSLAIGTVKNRIGLSAIYKSHMQISYVKILWLWRAAI